MEWSVVVVHMLDGTLRVSHAMPENCRRAWLSTLVDAQGRSVVVELVALPEPMRFGVTLSVSIYCQIG